jgi:hypothetical protein
MPSPFTSWEPVKTPCALRDHDPLPGLSHLLDILAGRRHRPYSAAARPTRPNVRNRQFWRRIMGSPNDRNPVTRIGADWAAVIVGGVLVLLAATGLLPAISFLVK